MEEKKIKKPLETEQIGYLINYHQDVTEQCLVHHRISEQSIEELTVQALKELQERRGRELAK